MTHRLGTLALILNSSQAALASRDSIHSSEWCAANKGQHQKTLPDRTRADCVTEDYAVEVEHAKDFYTGVGHALHYSTVTEKKAGLVLVLQRESDEKYYERVENMIEHHKLLIKLWRINEYEPPPKVEISTKAKASEEDPDSELAKLTPEDRRELEKSLEELNALIGPPSEPTKAAQEPATGTKPESKAVLTPAPPKKAPSELSCDDEKTCSKMRSCKEAKYHFHVCENTGLDGDSDGVPCDKLCQ